MADRKDDVTSAPFISFVVAVWRGKTAESYRVKYCGTLILAVLFASLALAEDFKTTNGKIYKDATITRIEGDGIVIRNKTGISKIYFVELPKDVQEKFHYGQATPIATQREREPIKLESTQDGPRQVNGGGKVVVVGRRSALGEADGGGRVVVVGQSPVSLKVIVAGIVVLVVVVLAVVRNRF